jgi:hypothetical protein
VEHLIIPYFMDILWTYLKKVKYNEKICKGQTHYLINLSNADVESSFVTLAPGHNVIKIFPVNYGFS